VTRPPRQPFPNPARPREPVSSMELAVVLAAMAVGAFVKGVTGSGLPQLAIPAIASFAGVEPAVVIMSIPGVVTNTWLLRTFWDHRGETRDLPVLLVMGSVGAVAGTWLLRSLNEDVLSVALGVIVVIYISVFFAHPTLRLGPRVTRKLSPGVGTAAGLLQGATGISGPLVTTYLHSFRLSKQAYIFSITTIFQVFAVVQTAMLVALGMFDRERLALSLISLIPIMILMPLGTRAAKRLPHRAFDLAVLAVMGLSAVRLLYDGLT